MGIAGSNDSAGAVVLAVSGMTCGGCASAVARAVSAVPGVVAARVDLAAGRVTVTGTARAEDLLLAVQDAGFAGGVA